MSASHTKLSVNINKVALLRNTRELDIPNVLWSARTCIEAGARGITVHPRPDERHIRPGDTRDIAALLKDHPDVEYNIEGNPFIEPYMTLVRETRPAQATLVPDSPNQSTSDHGWSLNADEMKRLTTLITELHDLGCRVSLFMDPRPELMELAKKTGADRIELYTESYASAFDTPRRDEVLQGFADAAKAAQRAGLGVNAGHDLNQDNLGLFLKTIPETAEVSIGHALIADALKVGLDRTVRDYLAICETSGLRL